MRRPRPAAAAAAVALLALALALARGADADGDAGGGSAWTAFEQDEPAYASSASVRAARAAWLGACIDPENTHGCGMAGLLSETEEHYRTLDRVLVIGACALGGSARSHTQQVGCAFADRVHFFFPGVVLSPQRC
jgi:hypothetical protein